MDAPPHALGVRLKMGHQGADLVGWRVALCGSGFVAQALRKGSGITEAMTAMVLERAGEGLQATARAIPNPG